MPKIMAMITFLNNQRILLKLTIPTKKQKTVLTFSFLFVTFFFTVYSTAQKSPHFFILNYITFNE